MTSGTLYGIGIGPGDPELLTLKGARLLKTCPHIFVPKARTAADSLALSITQTHIGPQAQIHEVVFPMTPDKDELRRRWRSFPSAKPKNRSRSFPPATISRTCAPRCAAAARLS